MFESRLNTLLAESISAISSVRFTSTLKRLLEFICPHDGAVILGYRAGKHPVYLYDSLEYNRQLLFQQYLMSAFQQDPFYEQLLQRQEGVFSLTQATKESAHRDYLRQFYTQTGWLDELCVLINIGVERDVLIFLGATDTKHSFTAKHIAQLSAYFPVIKALCQQHWRDAAFTLAHALDETIISGVTLRRHLDESLRAFARPLLTKRQQQIASLLVQGADSTEIAQQLGLAVGTVKNYRKKIYAQLHINSLSELFQLFLNHLLTHSTD